MHFNGRKFSSALEEFSITSRFWGSKIYKSTFLKKIRVLSAVFNKLKHRRLQTRLANLKKTLTTRIVAYERFFITFFNAHFPILSKIISCTYLNHCISFISCEHVRPNTVELDQPILTIFLSRLMSTSGLNMTISR